MNKNTELNNCEIYLVLSQTGSIISRLLKTVTKAKYNHSSISLTKVMTNMYSFGRIHLYNAFHGGYVKESINEGMYKRFSDTDAAVMVINVPEDTYNEICARLEDMYANRKQYGYDIIGIVAAYFGRHPKRKNKYYCSDFVCEVLTDFDIIPEDCFDRVVKPIDFYEHFRENLIYEGKFKDYSVPHGEKILTSS